jgi:dihydroneopterin aldolase
MTPKHTWKIFINDLELQAQVGILEHEIGTYQRIILDIVCDYHAFITKNSNDLSQIVSYSDLVEEIKKIVSSKHVFFLETLCQDIAQHCLSKDKIFHVYVKITKPDILPDTQKIGISIERSRDF